MKKKLCLAALVSCLFFGGAADALTTDRYVLRDTTGEFAGTAEVTNMARHQIMRLLVSTVKANPAGYTPRTFAEGVCEIDTKFPEGPKFKVRNCHSNPYGDEYIDEKIWVYPMEWEEDGFSLYSPKRKDSPWPPPEGRYLWKETAETELDAELACAFLHCVLEDGGLYDDMHLSFEVKELKERPFSGAAIGEYFRIVRKYDNKKTGIYFVDREGHHVYRDDENGQYNVMYDWKAPVDAPAP